MTTLVEKKVWGARFKANEWIENRKEYWSYSSHLQMSLVAPDITEANDRLHRDYAMFGGPTVNGDMIPRLKITLVEEISSKGLYWFPNDLTGKSKLWIGQYSFRDAYDHMEHRKGLRDNRKLKVAANTFSEAQKLVEDHSEQEEDALLQSITYQGEVFVSG